MVQIDVDSILKKYLKDRNSVDGTADQTETYRNDKKSPSEERITEKVR